MLVLSSHGKLLLHNSGTSGACILLCVVGSPYVLYIPLHPLTGRTPCWCLTVMQWCVCPGIAQVAPHCVVVGQPQAPLYNTPDHGDARAARQLASAA